MSENLGLLTDSYHLSQWPQYGDDVTRLYSHFLSRGGLFPEVTFFGLQYQMLKYLTTPMTADDVLDAYETSALHFGRDDIFNIKGFLHTVQHHGGLPPVVIKAVPEGTPVAVKNALFTIEATCDQCAWWSDHLETLLVQNWYPSMVATETRECKKIILRALEASGTPSDILFKLHCFGFRGASSVETAGIGGLAHLVNFRGSDTLKALEYGRKYYGSKCAGFSIPASQHSVMTVKGEAGELGQCERLLDKFPTGLVAGVSDSFDLLRCAGSYWGGKLRERVLQRNGVLIVRPDSGNPLEVLPALFRVLEQSFSATRNAKGFKVFDPHVRVIQGDGVNRASIEDIYDVIHKYGWSADNLAFGRGSAGLQEVKRDDQQFKLACSSATVAGKEVDVCKRPATDSRKASMGGRLALVLTHGGFHTIRESELNGRDNRLEEVYRDGTVRRFHQLDEIRERADLPLSHEAKAA